MNVSAIIVTRGNVDLQPVLESLPPEWEVVVWDNSGDSYVRRLDGTRYIMDTPDLSVYGRYAAIKYASHDLIYVQDDDVIVSDPQTIVGAWVQERDRLIESHARGFNAWGEHLIANMSQEFRHHGYIDSCLVGFGACFHRDLPRKAFDRYDAYWRGDRKPTGTFADLLPGWSIFNRTCDVVFTTLTPRVLVDVPVTHREFASDPDRMWKQPGHVEERARMLELARTVRDST